MELAWGKTRGRTARSTRPVIQPGIRDQFLELTRHGALAELTRRFASSAGQRARLAGLTPTAKALYLSLLWETLQQPLLVITESAKGAETLHELLETFHTLLHAGRAVPPPVLVPALDTLPGQNLSPHPELKAARAVALYRIASGRYSIAVAPVQAALLRTGDAAACRQLALTLKLNDEISMDDLAAHLASIGYERREPVEMEGEFSIRGGILDVFPALAQKPVRLEFFGDAIESLRRFDAETQRSVGRIDEVTLLPLEETPRTPALLRALAERLQRDDIVAGESFGGWEFAVPLVAPRRARSRISPAVPSSCGMSPRRSPPRANACGSGWISSPRRRHVPPNSSSSVGANSSPIASAARSSCANSLSRPTSPRRVKPTRRRIRWPPSRSRRVRRAPSATI